jgi:hypothetical protein
VMGMRKSNWYCFTDEELGPLSFREVVRNYASGIFQKGDLVRRHASDHWKPIEMVEDITLAAARLRPQCLGEQSSAFRPFQSDPSPRRFGRMVMPYLCLGIALLGIMVIFVAASDLHKKNSYSSEGTSID